FDKFYQFRSSEKMSISGFGIGLYLVKQFVEAHHGTVTYESEEGKGTVFRVFLPQGAAGMAVVAAESSAGLSALVREMAEERQVETVPDLPELVTDKPG